MKRAFVFIDGANFYHRVKSAARFEFDETHIARSTLDFKYDLFCKSLLTDGTELKSINYYIGQIRRLPPDSPDYEKTESMYSDQQKLVANLHRLGVNVKFGRVIKDRDGIYHEKGVDVQIAVEMIRHARRNDYDFAYLVSSDSDLIPAIKEVQSFKKGVIYVGVKKIQPVTTKAAGNPSAISFALMNICDDYKIIEKNEIIGHIPPKSP